MFLFNIIYTYGGGGMRRNNKSIISSQEDTIQKSNELALAKLNKGLTLNQMQLLAFAIFSTQKNGKTEFRKHEFEKKFELVDYKTERAKEDSEKLYDLKTSIVVLENEHFEFNHVFDNMVYKNGLFVFQWKSYIIPHILELKEKYISVDLTITSKFRSGYSWTLYEVLKAHYGYWYKTYAKEELFKLFGVEGVKTYEGNTAEFRRNVLDKAISEVNKYTEYDVRYECKKKGRSIVAFDIIWTVGGTLQKATGKQTSDIQRIIDAVFEDTFKYVNLKNDMHRERAITINRELEGMKAIVSDNGGITKEYATELYKKAEASLKELEYMLDYNRAAEQTQTESTNKVEFYNWLEEEKNENDK